MNLEIEYVARAFYDAEGDGCCWNGEPDIVKEEFRALAREAVMLLAKHEAQNPPGRRGMYSFAMDDVDVQIFKAA